MRKVLVILGVIFLILGAVLIVVPLIPSTASFTATPADCMSTPGCTVGYNIYTASPLVPTYAKLSWSAPGAVFFIAITCTKAVTGSQLDSANSSQQQADCGTSTIVGNTSGTSGSYTFTVPAGGSLVYLAIASSSTAPTVSATLTGTEPFLGLVVLVLGVILLILGVALRSKKVSGQPIAAPVAPPPSG